MHGLLLAQKLGFARVAFAICNQSLSMNGIKIWLSFIHDG